MANSLPILGMLGTAANALSKGAANMVGAREHQKTVRLQTKVSAASNLASCTQELVTAAIAYKQIVEQERSRRHAISAWETAYLEKVKQNRDILISALDHTFDERAGNFRALFNVVDHALTTGNSQQLQMALDGIIQLTQSNPFKDLADLASVQASLNDTNHEWKF